MKVIAVKFAKYLHIKLASSHHFRNATALEKS